MIRETQGALALQPTVDASRFYQALAYLFTRRFDDCTNVLGDAFPGVRTMCQHSRGNEEGVIQIVDSLKSTLESSNEPAGHAESVLYRDIAMFYAWIGNAEESLDWLERVSSWSHTLISGLVMRNKVFDRVSEDPGFQSGLEHIQAQVKQ